MVAVRANVAREWTPSRATDDKPVREFLRFGESPLVGDDLGEIRHRGEGIEVLLSEDALVDTMPQLEIFADDVKCTHGATVGRLDELSQFYMKSRGIGADRSRALLTYAFAAEVLELIELEPLKVALEALLFARFIPPDTV